MEQDTPESRVQSGNQLRVDIIDQESPSPSVRAKYIYDKLNALEPKPTHWDLVCFCAEGLGMLMLEFPQLQDQVKELLVYVYNLHYYGGDINPSCLSQNSKISPTSLSDQQQTEDTTGTQPSVELMVEKSTPFVLD